MVCFSHKHTHSHSCGLPAVPGLRCDSCVVADMVCALWHLSQQKPTPLGKKKCLRKFADAIWRTSFLSFSCLCALSPSSAHLRLVPAAPVSQHMSKRSCHPPVSPQDRFLHLSFPFLLPYHMPSHLYRAFVVSHPASWRSPWSAPVITVKLGFELPHAVVVVGSTAKNVIMSNFISW